MTRDQAVAAIFRVMLAHELKIGGGMMADRQSSLHNEAIKITDYLAEVGAIALESEQNQVRKVIETALGAMKHSPVEPVGWAGAVLVDLEVAGFEIVRKK